MTALILVALVVICSLIGRTAFFVLVLVVVSIALFELLDAAVQKGHRPAIPIGVAGGAGAMAAAYFGRPWMIAAVVLVAAVAALGFALRSTRGPTPITDAAWTILAVVWVGGGGAGAVSILKLGTDGILLLISVVFVIALDDIGAYFVGVNLGRHKLAPSISPGKSWEGTIAGSIVALGAGATVGAVLYDLSLWEGIGLGAMCAVLGPVGDLVESLAKREMGIKDSGRVLPGHGGFLDRLDAIIFCVAPAYLYLRLVVY